MCGVWIFRTIFIIPKYFVFLFILSVCLCVTLSNSHHRHFFFHLPFHSLLPQSIFLLFYSNIRTQTAYNIMTFANHLLIIDVRKMDGISIEPTIGAMKCFKALFMCACMCLTYERMYICVCYVFQMCACIFFVFLRYHALDMCV